jgi:hypothetical protein
MPFRSQAQQRFAFGTGQPWAKRWGDQTDFSHLPKRVRRRKMRIKAVSADTTTGGVAAPAKPAAKPAAGGPGELIAPGIRRIRGNLCNVHGRYGPCDAALSKKPKGGKGKKPKAPKVAKPKAPKAPKGKDPAAVARQQQRDQEHAQDRAARQQRQAQADATRQQREQALAKRDQERTQRQQQIAARRAKPAAAPKTPATPKPAAPPARAGGTSGGGGKGGSSGGGSYTAPKPKPAPPAQQAPAKQQPAVTTPELADAARKLSAGQTLTPEETDGLVRNGLARIDKKTGAIVLTVQGQRATRQTAKQARRERFKAMQSLKAGSPGDYLVVEDRTKPSTWHLQVRTNGKPDHRLMGAAWAALHGGYRGNKYSGPNAGAALSKLRALYASEGIPLPSEKEATFQVYKDASGVDRWLLVSSTAYRDRDREIVSTKALEGAVALADASGVRGPLRFWHVPGVDLGDCDFQATAQDGRFLIESGTFRSPALAAAVKAHADRYQVSIGFTHPANEPDAEGVFSHIAIFERSLVPRGRAANPFTEVAVKESRMLTTEKETELKALLGGDTSLLQGLLGQVAETDKAAQDGGIAFKDDDAPPSWAQALIARFDTIEASFKALTDLADAPASETEKAAPPMDMGGADQETPEETTAEGGVEEPGEENMLTDAEISAIATQTAQVLLDALMPHLGIGQKMDEVKGLLGSMAGSYAKKDAELAEVKESLETVKAHVADLSGSAPRILAGGYRASQSTATITTDESKLKEAQPTSDPVSQSFGAFMSDLGFGPPAQPGV